MVVHRLGWVIFGVCSVSSVAHAGGTSSESGSGSSESGSDSTGVDTTGGETTGAGSTDGGETQVSGDLTDSDSCGGTCSGDGGVVFDRPQMTDVVSPFVVTVTPLVGCSCDTCGCFDDSAFAVHVELDGMSVGSCKGDDPCTIEVSAPVGEHELRGTAEYSFHGVGETMTINVTASEQDPNGTAGGVTANGETSGSDTSEGLQDDEAKGCGCTTSSDRSGAWWLTAFAIVVGRRRRPLRMTSWRPRSRPSPRR